VICYAHFYMYDVPKILVMWRLQPQNFSGTHKKKLNDCLLTSCMVFACTKYHELFSQNQYFRITNDGIKNPLLKDVD